MSKFIFGIIGNPGSGKDKLADILCSRLGFVKIAFADKIKEGFFSNSEYSNKIFKNSRGTKIEEEIRKGLWDYSKRQKDRFGKRYFINIVLDQIKKSDSRVVVTDIRDKEELYAMREINSDLFIIKSYSDGGEDISEIKFPMSEISALPIFINAFNGDENLYCDFLSFFNNNFSGRTI